MKRFKWLILSALIISACAPTITSTPGSTPSRTSLAPSSPTLISTPVVTITKTAASPTPTSVPIATLVKTAIPIPTNNPTPSNRSISIKLQGVASDITNPTNLVSANDNSDRLFVTAKPGLIQIISQSQLIDQPFLDITDRVLGESSERGLLGLAFSPNYATDGFFYVDYTRQPDAATIIARYRVSKDDPNIADPSSEEILLKIGQPEANHNGGQLAFGPDGYLYIALGDGGGAGDQHGRNGNAQNQKSLLGKILRIDVSPAEGYTIPPSNPFSDEIWAYGLRNPWRFSFDRATGDLYIADVGQNNYEEINFQAAHDPGGENYGWRIMEGLHCYNPGTGCDQTGLTLPVLEYTHDLGCAITGGYVYRGTKYPQLTGLYFFADYCSGFIWTLSRSARGEWQMIKRLESGLNISSFGQDQSGELYVLGLDSNSVYRVVAQ